MCWEPIVIVTNNLLERSIVSQFYEISVFFSMTHLVEVIAQSNRFVVKTHRDLAEVQTGGVILFLLSVHQSLLGA